MPPSSSAAETPGHVLALEGRVHGLAFSPDGTLLATVGGDGPVQLWDAVSGAAAGPPLLGSSGLKADLWHAGLGGDLSFSPDGKSLAWRRGGRAIVWDVATRQPIGATDGARVSAGTPRLPGSPVCFSPDGQTLLLQAKGDLVLWSPSKRGPVGPPLKDRESFQVRFSPNGELLVSGDGQHVTLWDVGTAQPLGPTLEARQGLLERWDGNPGFTERVDGTALVWSPDGRFLAGVARHEVVVWDVGRRRPLGTLASRKGRGEWFSGAPSAATFRPDGRVLAWITANGLVMLWDAEKAQPIGSPLPVAVPPGDARTLAFSPDGTRLAAGNDAFGVTLWEVATGSQAGDLFAAGFDAVHLPVREGGVSELEFTPDGNTLIVETSGPTFLDLWDVAQQPPRRLSRFDHLDKLGLAGGPGVFTRLSADMGITPWGVHAFTSPDGKTLAFRKGGQLQLLDLTRREGLDQPVVVPGGGGEVIAFSPDGATLVTMRDRKEGALVTLWDLSALLPGSQRARRSARSRSTIRP